MPSRPVAEGLFGVDADGAYLLGGRCGECTTVTFPVQRGCPRCGADAMTDVRLGRRGPLFTFTTQEFLPKAPYAGPGTDDDYAPFAVGYVELPEVVVEGRLTEADPDRLAIGMTMEVVVVPFTTDPDGTEVLTYAFAPASGAASEPAVEGPGEGVGA